LYRDTLIIPKALYLDCKNTRHASLIPASKALSHDAGILLMASTRSATLSNYTAGPLCLSLKPLRDNFAMTTKA
jgi:hypothetical protein